MTAEQGRSNDTFAYEKMHELALEALRYDLYGFLCGEIEYEIAYGAGADLSILSLNAEDETIILKPSTSAPPGLYDTNWLRFYYVNFPEIKMDV